jgi:DNA modification methylase
MVSTLTGDCRIILPTLPEKSHRCCVTSPPYFGLRDYGHADQLGREKTPDEYVATMVSVFREVRRVLTDDGTLWLNIGDSYSNSGEQLRPSGGEHVKALHGVSGVGRVSVEGVPPKNLIGIPWLLAFALRADGWFLRCDIIWHKKNCMPESVTDRPTKAHEYLFLLSKREKYFYDSVAATEPSIYDDGVTFAKSTAGRKYRAEQGHKSNPTKEINGVRPDKQRGHPRKHAGFNDRWDHMTRTEQSAGRRNWRSVWPLATEPNSFRHFAVMPESLAERCIAAGSKPGDSVLDPFGGSGTTGRVASRLGRSATLIELNPKYVAISEQRTAQTGMVIDGA